MPEDQIPTPQPNAPVSPDTQQVYSQQPYAQPVYTQPAYAQPARPSMSLGSWVITLILTAIPIVGIIMLFVWGFSRDADPNRKVWAQAQLIITAIGIVLCVLYMIAFGSILLATMQSSGSYYY